MPASSAARFTRPMQSPSSPLNRLRAVVWSTVVSFAILVFASGAWGALYVGNLMTTPTIPWSVPAMALVLWLMWRYLGGQGWPRSTAPARRAYLYVNPVSRQVFAWALLAGVLGIVALAGWWIVAFNLVPMAGNALPDLTKYPMLTLVLIAIMGSLVSPLSEEAAFRGYAQLRLLRAFSAPAAILISSVLFALAHLTQGLYLPKLLVYFLGGLMFGAIAYRTRSLVPGIVVHILADMTFFILVWPYDTQRLLIWTNGADVWFWIHLAQAIIFTVLAILAFRRLAKATEK
jgi:membrane protease YdiL (CAAX protease family)